MSRLEAEREEVIVGEVGGRDGICGGRSGGRGAGGGVQEGGAEGRWEIRGAVAVVPRVAVAVLVV